MYAALMSQLSIIRLLSTGEIAGENIPPPPDKPTGSQGICLTTVSEWAAFCSPYIDIVSSSENPQHRKNKNIPRYFMVQLFLELIMYSFVVSTNKAKSTFKSKYDFSPGYHFTVIMFSFKNRFRFNSFGFNITDLSLILKTSI
jgi:hypothetical protein